MMLFISLHYRAPLGFLRGSAIQGGGRLNETGGANLLRGLTRLSVLRTFRKTWIFLKVLKFKIDFFWQRDNFINVC